MTTEAENPYKVRVKVPGDLEYIPTVRKFVAEVLQVNKFSPKFAFRSEIIIDEICNNAVSYGCLGADPFVEVECNVFPEHVEFQVKDSGGNTNDLKRLRKSVALAEGDIEIPKDGKPTPGGLGLEIVRMLSEEVSLEIEDDNLTSVRIVRRRDDAPSGEK